MKPIAVIQYSGAGPHGLAPRYGDSLAPHTQDADFLRTLREMGWAICRHLPLGDLTPNDHMDADIVADQIDAGKFPIVRDYLRNGGSADYDYWGSPTASDLANAAPVTFYSRLAATLQAMKSAGTVPILDHAGTNSTGRMAVWVAMVAAETGHKPITEPWPIDGRGLCLERFYFRELLVAQCPLGTAPEIGIRWYSGHTMLDGSLPWGGRLDHWLRHVESRGHTPAFTLNPSTDDPMPADAYLDAVRAAKVNK